jgi:pyrimidine operon attenuation protein/uracil phosphoribosyltransferase
MTDTPDDRTLRLLDVVGRHCRTIAAAIDELTKIGAKRELHLISVRLFELSCRAEPARFYNKEDIGNEEEKL